MIATVVVYLWSGLLLLVGLGCVLFAAFVVIEETIDTRQARQRNDAFYRDEIDRYR